jgi:hypothetical protein
MRSMLLEKEQSSATSLQTYDDFGPLFNKSTFKRSHSSSAYQRQHPYSPPMVSPINALASAPAAPAAPLTPTALNRVTANKLDLNLFWKYTPASYFSRTTACETSSPSPGPAPRKKAVAFSAASTSLLGEISPSNGLLSSSDQPFAGNLLTST